MTTATPKIATRVFVISDTHGTPIKSADGLDVCADVALHCGDLTDGSTLEEFRTILQMISNIKAPLKLVIAGNHDFTLDAEAFQRKLTETVPALDPDLVAEYYGLTEQIRQLFDDAKSEGIVFLDEGTHHFKLENGAALTVYASPYTPSYGAWGFQYHPDMGHHFDIQPSTDIVMTHGPPKGIFDYTHGRERAGCSSLFESIADKRPLMHCFGHIHEGWGARYVTWKNSGNSVASHFTAINNERSHNILKLSDFKAGRHDTTEMMQEKERLEHDTLQQGYTATSHCENDKLWLEPGKQTVFVNAAVCGSDGSTQFPWLIDVELPTYK